jgi:Tol biopolymer transport system component
VAEDPGTPGTRDGFTFRVWVYALDRAPRRLLYEHPGCCIGLDGVGRPVWSPDGSRIALNGLVSADGTANYSDIALMTFDVADGTRTILVPTTEAYKNTPAWRALPATP